MSCYAKHPEVPGIECWHGPDHAGDHGKENRTWPNADDPKERELLALRAVADAARIYVDTDYSHLNEDMAALYAALKAAGR